MVKKWMKACCLVAAMIGTAQMTDTPARAARAAVRRTGLAGRIGPGPASGCGPPAGAGVG